VTGNIEEKRGGPLGLIAWGTGAAVVIAGLTWASATGQLTWSMAVDAKAAASGFVAGNAVLAYAIYIALFVAMALALFPAQLWIIMFGAMLFGFWPALIVSWAATVTSAIVVFALARGVMAGRYRAKAGKYLAKVEAGFRLDQLSWILAMRLFPAVPYCITNVAPAVLGARMAPFVVATLIGVIPYVAAYTFAGDKAAAVLDADIAPDVGRLAGDLFPVMLALAALPVAAILVRKLWKKPEGETPS
jgi:uncharacterized membrane protein YdjX (TVP38/TMEM64 family)